MGVVLKAKRGTRAQLDAAASANQLVQGETYLITDEARLAIGTAANAYQAAAKQGEGGGLAAVKSALISLAASGAREATLTVADAEVSGSSKIAGLTIAPPQSEIENGPDWLDIKTLGIAAVRAGSFDVFLSLHTPARGGVRLNYMIG